MKETNLGGANIDTTISIDKIGNIFEEKGDYHQALQFYKKTLKIQEKELGSNNTVTALSYSNIGRTYFHILKYELALTYFKKAVKI